MGDFDSDGKRDLATSNFSGSTVSVLLGDGSGSSAVKIDYAVGVNPLGIGIGDFNGDAE